MTHIYPNGTKHEIINDQHAYQCSHGGTFVTDGKLSKDTPQAIFRSKAKIAGHENVYLTMSDNGVECEHNPI